MISQQVLKFYQIDASCIAICIRCKYNRRERSGSFREALLGCGGSTEGFERMKHLDIIWTNQFKKDYKSAIKRHLNIDLLDDIIRKLSSGETLPEKNRDHALTGNWSGHRECHIQPDWLLVYRIEDDVLVLTLARTGTHSDLFGK